MSKRIPVFKKFVDWDQADWSKPDWHIAITMDCSRNAVRIARKNRGIAKVDTKFVSKKFGSLKY
jgi:hypothetical protein